MLWHKVIRMIMDDSVVKEILKFYNFWGQKHWFPKHDIIYLSIDDGGQRLIDIDSRIKTFRLEY